MSAFIGILNDLCLMGFAGVFGVELVHTAAHHVTQAIKAIPVRSTSSFRCTITDGRPAWLFGCNPNARCNFVFHLHSAMPAGRLML